MMYCMMYDDRSKTLGVSTAETQLASTLPHISGMSMLCDTLTVTLSYMCLLVFDIVTSLLL